MKAWKLVSGIISIVLCVYVVGQSLIAGVGDALINAMSQSGSSISGSAGSLVSVKGCQEEIRTAQKIEA